MKTISSLILVISIVTISVLAGDKTPPPVVKIVEAPISVKNVPAPVFDYSQQWATNRSVFRDGQWMTEVASKDGTTLFPKGTNAYPGGVQDNWYRSPAQDAVATKETSVANANSQQQVVYRRPIYNSYSYSSPYYGSSYYGSDYGYNGGYYYSSYPSYRSYGYYGPYRSVTYHSESHVGIGVGVGVSTYPHRRHR